MPEILMILVIALIIFGPRKLPELGKTLGNSLALFRRASEDFKRQWEDEVEIERRRIDVPEAPAVQHATQPASIAEGETKPEPGPEHAAGVAEEPLAVANTGVTVSASEAVASAHSDHTPQETKRDWM
jgi:TatA/E family protein of Tat protein translocase